MLINQMNRQQLLHWIDMVSFMVMDLTLYLDTHSRDEEALKLFDHYSEARRVAMQAYADKYGPLTIDSAVSNNYWAWAEQPWPWEGGNC